MTLQPNQKQHCITLCKCAAPMIMKRCTFFVCKVDTVARLRDPAAVKWLHAKKKEARFSRWSISWRKTDANRIEVVCCASHHYSWWSAAAASRNDFLKNYGSRHQIPAYSSATRQRCTQRCLIVSHVCSGPLTRTIWHLRAPMLPGHPRDPPTASWARNIRRPVSSLCRHEHWWCVLHAFQQLEGRTHDLGHLLCLSAHVLKLRPGEPSSKACRKIVWDQMLTCCQNYPQFWSLCESDWGPGILWKTP